MFHCRQILSLAAVLFLAAALVTGCESKDKGDESSGEESEESEESGAESGGEGDESGKSSGSSSDGDDRAARREAKKKAEGVLEDEFAPRLEKLVMEGNADELKALIADPEQLAGCAKGEMGKPGERVPGDPASDELAEDMEDIVSRIDVITGRQHEGEPFDQRRPVWSNRGVNHAFIGDNCPVKIFGEAWFSLFVADDKYVGSKYRFRLVLLDDEWRIVGRVGDDTVRSCESADKHSNICKKKRGEPIE